LTARQSSYSIKVLHRFGKAETEDRYLLGAPFMTLYEALILAFDTFNIKIPKNSKGITKEMLIQFISTRQSTQKGALGYSTQGWIDFIKKVFPDKPKNTNYYEWLLFKLELKYCNTCNIVKPITAFWNTKNNASSGRQSWCIDCFEPINAIKCRSTTATYRARKLKAIPLWADLAKIKKFYDNCPIGYHVDHIYPLAGKTVCGLHTLENLQYLPAQENLQKGNSL